jgi:para-nitrobenzyl esterase
MLVRYVRCSRALATKAISLTVLMLLGGMVFAKPVKVEGGLLQGMAEDGLTIYRGIPYATPPVGDLRWRAPQPAPKWEGVRAADQFGRACIQTNAAISNLPAPSEDCLFLNVWTPAKRAEEKLPVLVWIHGGGFSAGTPAEKTYQGEWLAKKGVVVVSIGYRLGVLGFLAHAELSAESDKHVSGNYGLLDMIAGLQWVQRNISAFGGNPKRVTISGESAGAIAVSMLCASPLAKGLFHGAISQSGGSFGPVHAGGGPGENMQPLSEGEKAGAAWLPSTGASNIAELRKLPAEKVQAASQRQRGLAWPIMDGWVIPDDQYKLYQAGRYNDVTVLIGYNSDEGATFGVPRSQEAYVESVRQRYGQFADKILAAYPGGETPAAKKTARDLTRDTAFGWHTWIWARLQTKTGKSKAFLYYFDEHPDYPADSPRAGFGAPHASELPFTFHQLEGPNHPTPATPKDEALSDMMRTYWTNFTKTGDPNGASLPNWPAYHDAKPQMLHISSAGTKAGPIVDVDGLKALDEYFALRRTTEAAPPAGGTPTKK